MESWWPQLCTGCSSSLFRLKLLAVHVPSQLPLGSSLLCWSLTVSRYRGTWALMLNLVWGIRWEPFLSPSRLMLVLRKRVHLPQAGLCPGPELALVPVLSLLRPHLLLSPTLAWYQLFLTL